MDQEPVHSDEDAVSDEETGYYRKVHLTATSSQYRLYHDYVKTGMALLRVQTTNSFVSLVLTLTGSN